jgi:hypothetical protein
LEGKEGAWGLARREKVDVRSVLQFRGVPQEFGSFFQALPLAFKIENSFHDAFKKCFVARFW